MTIQSFYRPDEEVQSEPLHYTDCGLDNIFLQNGFKKETIDGEEYVSVTDLDGLHAAIGLHIALERKAPLPRELRFLRDEMGFSQADLAKTLGISPQTVARWEKGQCETANGAAVFALRIVYLLSLTPEENRDRLLTDIVQRLTDLSDRDETSDSITLSYFGHKWHSPDMMVAA